MIGVMLYNEEWRFFLTAWSGYDELCFCFVGRKYEGDTAETG